MTKTQVYLGIGSNIDRETNIRDGLKELQKRFGDLTISPIYETEAFGFVGDDFYNLVVGLKTELAIEDLAKQLRDIEFQSGRCRNETRYSSRTLDVDLLLFANEIYEKHHVPRSDIMEFGFVLKPLCDIEPELKHPVTGETMSKLWEMFDSSREVMRKIPQSFDL